MVDSADNSIVRRQPGPGEEETLPEPICPECLKTRNVDQESEKEKQQYYDYVKPHELPGIAEKRDALEKERIARQQHLKQRMGPGKESIKDRVLPKKKP